VETELLNQITNLVISLVIVLQITPWVLLLLGFFIMRHMERRGQTKPVSSQTKTLERR
jgi:cytochrome c-type biogenesis protein CcmH/NrfF